MLAAQVIIKMQFKVGLVNIKCQLIRIQRQLVAGNIVVITVITTRNKAVKLIVKNMLPL